MGDESSPHDLKGLDSVINGSVTISALLTGFMLLFIGLVVQDSREQSWLHYACLFVGSALLEYFYRAMVKGWNLLAVRTLAETADRIVSGRLDSGPDRAAFRVLWGFQPNLVHASWFILLLVVLYSATKSLWNVPVAIGGFLTGLLMYAIVGERGWLKTWQRYGEFDEMIYLGKIPPRLEDVSWRFRVYLRLFGILGEQTRTNATVRDGEQGQDRSRETGHPNN